MARCLATPPCNYQANGEVHDPGCPQRGDYWDNPELSRLYASETAEERARLTAALEHALDCGLLDTGPYRDLLPEDVTAGEPEWLAIRRAIRDGASDTQLCDRFGVRWDATTEAPELYCKTPACAACGVALVHRPDHPGAELGDWWVHPRGDHEHLIGHTDATMLPAGKA